MAKRRLKGAGKVRRMLKRLPDDVRDNLVAEMRKAEPVILAAAKSEAPVATGALRGAISSKLFPKSMRLQVGILTRAQFRKVWYGRILEVGRRAGTYRRRGKSGRFHNIRLPEIPRGKFDIVQGRTRKLAIRLLRPALNLSYERALARAARETPDD